MSLRSETIPKARHIPAWRLEPMEEIPFHPTPVDVIATKVRTWNIHHPGNIFYRNSIKAAVKDCDLSTPPNTRSCAVALYNILVTERGGRFLKLPEENSTTTDHPHTCKVMTERRIVEKIIHALKTTKARLENEKQRNKTPSSKSNKTKDNIQSHEEAYLRELTKSTSKGKKRKLVR